MSKLLIGLLTLILLAVIEIIEIGVLALFVYGICLVFSIAFSFKIVLGLYIMIAAVRILKAVI